MSLTKTSYSMIQGAPLSVLDFGAVGNGVTDDTAAIQAAINTASANGGGTVYLPNTGSDYIVTAPIKLLPYVTVQGDFYTSGIGSAVNNTPGIRKTTNTTVSITNFDTGIPYTVDCVFYTEFLFFAGTDFITGAATNFFPAVFLLDRLYIKGDGPNLITTGVHMDFGAGLMFTNSRVANVTYGFYGRNVFISKLERVSTTGKLRIAQTGTSFNFENCTANAGFMVQNLFYSKLTRCTCDGLVGDSAYYFKSCRGVTVDSCGVEANIPASSTDGIFKFDTANQIVVLCPTIVHTTTATTYPCFSVGTFDRIEVIGGDFSVGAANAPNAYDIYANVNAATYFNNTSFVGIAVAGGYVQNPIKASVVGSATTGGIVTVDYTEASNTFDENGAQSKRMTVTTISANPTPTVYNSYNKLLRGETGSGQFAAATSDAVALTRTQPNANYRVSVTFTSDPGGYGWVTSKTTSGFTVNCSASTSATYDWSISY
jgi:hypothetical protein